MRVAELLRLTVLGLAVLCLLDPPVLVAVLPPIEVDVAVVRSERDDGPGGDDGRARLEDRTTAAAAALRAALAGDAEVRIHETPAGAVVPCDAQHPCVIVTDGAGVQVPADRRGPVSAVLVGERPSPNLEITGLEVPAAHAGGRASARVSMAGIGLTGRSTRVRLHDGALVLGVAEHRWTGDGEVSVDVPWWPAMPGRRTLVARGATDGVEERTLADNAASADADIRDERWPVIVVERRPSWATTFVRRALEADARFDVRTRTDVAPEVSVTTGAVALLADESLDEARVAVVGATDALESDDVARLERFARTRGGAVVLLPDRVLGPAVRPLLAHQWVERLEPAPARAGALVASEWLVARAVSPVDHVLAAGTAGPAVVATPTGAGTVVVAGALDAWRHRGTGSGFDAFWQATVARLAAAVPPVVELTATPARPVPGEDVRVRLVARSVRRLDRWTARAALACADGTRMPVRLWPGDGPGAFAGQVPVGTSASCRLDASLTGLGSARLSFDPVSADLRSRRWRRPELEALTTRTGGVLVRDADLTALVAAIRASRGAERRPEPRYPMRSAWWFAPLVAGLGGEWWLRRRAGLR